jgi:hypothetical protein
MPAHPSYTSTRRTTQGATLVAAVFCALGGCKGPKAPPQLPQFPTAPQAVHHRAERAGVRSHSGTPIAPMVIDDTPTPTEAQPASQNKPGQRATLNGDPNGLSRETLNRSIQGAMGSLANCFASLTEDPMVAISFEADPSGRPSLVRVNGAPPDAERCLRNVVQNMRFPSFDGKSVQVDLPLSFHRVAQPNQAGNSASGKQAPTGPPLFLQP